MGLGIDQWEWEGMGILTVFPHTSNASCDIRTTNSSMNDMTVVYLVR